MIVKPISTPQFVYVVSQDGKLRLYVPRGPQKNFLVSLNKDEMKRVAHHNYIMTLPSEKTLCDCFSWGMISLTNLTLKNLEIADKDGP